MSGEEKKGENDQSPEIGEEKTIAEEVAEKEAARENISDLAEARVRELAKNEIEVWEKQREEAAPKLLDPRTWGNRTLGGAIAGAAFAIAAFLIAPKVISLEDLREGLHRGAGTDKRVETALKGFESRGATPENPIFRLIAQTLRSAPVLAFHGQAAFGESIFLSVSNPACQNLYRAQFSGNYDDIPLPEGAEELDVEEKCRIDIEVEAPQSLDIPFHARFYETGERDGRRSRRKHQVWLILVVDRKSQVDDRQLPPERTNDNRPAGLCILYTPSSEAARVENGFPIKTWQGTGNGFWISNLTGSLDEAGVWPAIMGNPEATTLMHSVSIKKVGRQDAQMTSQSGSVHRLGPETTDELCSDVPPVMDQNIRVTAMILVNKNANE